MELSRHELLELVQYLEADPDIEEIRRSARVLIRRRMKIIADPSDPLRTETDIVLHDISRGGVCLTHHEGMPRGKQFILLLPGPGKSFVSMLCTVRHCQMIKQHLFRIGAQFDNMLPIDHDADGARAE